MATSNRAKRTFLVEALTGLRIYVLDSLATLPQWVIGPDGADPRTLDPDNLPEGFSYVCPDHTNEGEDEAEIVLYSQAENWRESHYIGGLIDSALATAGATGEEAACDIDTADFDDLLDDLQCDVINFLVDRGYSVSCKPNPQRHGIGVIVDTYAPEQQAIIEKALEAAVAASKPAYVERAARLVQGLRAIEQEKQDAKRLALFDEAVELLDDLRYAGDADQLQQISDFLAKVAKK
jgi:hypothetical protein